jgi:hypothetical protein
MPLSRALVDRARLLRKAASATKVGGRTTFVDTEPGTWFPARLTLPTATNEQTPSGFSSRRVVLVPTLLFDVEDDDGTEVEVRFNDMVEVESEDLGSTTWQVTAEPMPMRKREGIIGYSTTLRRVEVHDFEPKVA